ncbi:IBR/half ring-finger domain containing protein [Nitzschia inconspicua]|uniref:IBR/half ring-finger domain containing protein n=1 Tax=Nitzschia inconspicua TaxID=303405 RepID=A0A9K3KZ20_9STRA|nr:IBR/half ring-finger domain containing protein [Nitzschia inconspicua]
MVAIRFAVLIATADLSIVLFSDTLPPADRDNSEKIRSIEATKVTVVESFHRKNTTKSREDVDDMEFDRNNQLKLQAEEMKKFEAWRAENSQAEQRFREMLDKELKEGTTMPCPNCNIPITKIGGCQHMHCTACKTDFNWNGK